MHNSSTVHPIKRETSSNQGLLSLQIAMISSYSMFSHVCVRALLMYYLGKCHQLCISKPIHLL